MHDDEDLLRRVLDLVWADAEPLQDAEDVAHVLPVHPLDVEWG